MVTTRSAQSPSSSLALLDALLTGNSSRARLLLSQEPQRAHIAGPSGFGSLHAAALTDCHRMVAPLVGAGLSVDQQIGALDGPAAFALREFLREHSKLPSSKLCAVFRGVTALHIAAWLGHQNTVQALLQAGAETELPCLEGRTALAIACYFLDCRPKRSLAIVEALLGAGADALCSDFHGIGTLVLSPHCPISMQALLLERVMCRCGFQPSPSKPAQPQPQPQSYSAATSGSEGSPGASHPIAGLAGNAASEGTQQLEPVELALPLLPSDKHVDLLQAALTAKHWQAFDFFLDATSVETAYPPHSVNRILSLAIASGDVPLVLRILNSGLRPDAAGLNGQGHPHIAVAAVHGHEAVVDVLQAHGASVTLRALHHAADSRSLPGLRLLLARGRPPVLTGEAPVHIGGAHSRTGEQCIMLRLLRDTAFRLRYCYRVDQPRHAADSLAMVEALAEAGYRPTIYPQAIVHNGWIDMQGRLVQDYDPTLDKPAAFDLGGVNRHTWLAAKCEPWTTACHPRWPTKFKAAVRQLLLVYHAGRVGAGSNAAASGAGAGPLTRARKRARLALDPPALQPAAAAAPVAKAEWRGHRRGRKASQAAQASQPAVAEQAAGAAPVVAVPAARRPIVAALPPELLLNIIEQAAYPVSAWVDEADRVEVPRESRWMLM